MDRSFLSVPAVVEASRDFVCVRLLTYESAEEGKFLESLLKTRSGLLENTVFTVLAPDGKTPLVPAGRTIRAAFPAPPEQAANDLAAGLKRMAGQYPAKTDAARHLPYVVDLRRGINVAACDLQPLVVVAGAEETRKKIEEALAPLAWSREFIGKFAYAPSATEALGAIDGAPRRAGVLVVQPDPYGVKASLLAATEALDAEGLKKVLAEGLKKFAPQSKDTRSHIDEGHRRGIHWETVIPDTDPGPGGGPPKK